MEDLVRTERIGLAADGLQAAPESGERLVARLGQFDGGRALARKPRDFFIDQLFGASHGAARWHDGVHVCEARIEALLQERASLYGGLLLLHEALMQARRVAIAEDRHQHLEYPRLPVGRGGGVPGHQQQRRLGVAHHGYASFPQLLGFTVVTGGDAGCAGMLARYLSARPNTVAGSTSPTMNITALFGA